MNMRLRAYVAVIAFRHITTAVILYVDRFRYREFKSFLTLFEIASPTEWAILAAAVGLAAVVAVVTQGLLITRIALYGSVFISIVWAASFLFTKLEVPSTSFLLLSLYGALAAKDFIVTIGTPYRSMTK